MEAAYEATAALLSRRPDVTALFAVADSMAIAAMKALYEFGLRVPEDCSVIAIDGIESSLYTTPTLTTLSQPQETLGKEAVRILVDVAEGRTKSSHIRLDTALRPGGTIGTVR
jgi:LacI family transcriptional regulator